MKRPTLDKIDAADAIDEVVSLLGAAHALAETPSPLGNDGLLTVIQVAQEKLAAIKVALPA